MNTSLNVFAGSKGNDVKEGKAAKELGSKAAEGVRKKPKGLGAVKI